MGPYSIILSTCKDFEEAKNVSLTLLKEKLAACVSILPIHSFYFWKDDIEESKEQLLIIKTAWKLNHKVEKCIREIHSYEVPEVLALKIEFGSKGYLNWLEETIKH
ncbi:MAG: divalent-cation tolerance protein CutA [Candidatus Bathyarchaeia archaeon]